MVAAPQRLPQAHGAVEQPVGVLGHVGDAVVVGAEVGFHVQHHAGGRVPLRQGCQISEGGQERARLAQPIGGHVERVLPKVQASHQRLQFPRARVKGDHGRFVHIAPHRLPARLGQFGQCGATAGLVGGQAQPPAQPVHMGASDAFRLALQAQIERGVHPPPLAQKRLRPKLRQQLLAHIQRIVRGNQVVAALLGRCSPDQRRKLGRHNRLAAIHPLRQQRVQHCLLSRFGGCGVLDGVLFGGKGDGHENGRFGQAQLAGGFAKIELRGRLNPVGQLPIIGRVHIPLHQFRLAVSLGEALGEEVVLDSE